MSLQLNSAPLLHSCERCRQKKRKCSGDKPTCTWCRKHNAVCEYRQSIRIRKQLDALPPGGGSLIPCPDGKLVGYSHTVSMGPSSTSTKSSASTSTGCHQSSSQLQISAPVEIPAICHSQAPLQTSAPLPVQRSNIAIDTIQSSAQHLSPIPLTVLTPPLLMAASDLSSPLSTSVPLGLSPHTAASNATQMLSADALAQLLAGDIMPLNNPVPPNILQYVNTFMSPFSDVSVPPKPNILTEDRPENRILDNLGGLAIQKPHVAPSKIMPGADILQSTQPACRGGDNQLTLDHLQFLDSLLSDSSSIASSGGASDFFTPSADASLFNTAGSPQCINQPPMMGSAPPASTVCPATSESNRPETVNAASIASLLSPVLDKPTHSGADSTRKRPQRAMEPPCDNIGIDDAQFIPKIIEKAGSRQPCSPFVGIPQMQSAASKDSFDYDNYPEMLDECTKDLGSIISARDLYKLLADIFVAPRSVYLVEYMEVMWYLLTHNALPPLCVHTLISGNLRSAVISEEHVLNLPPELEEVCYARAIKEIDQLRGSSSPIFAIAATFLAIYDFQSGRYPEMIEHIELAHAVMFRCKIKGYGYPWRNVPDDVAQLPVYNFCITTFWHTYSLRNLFSMLLTSKNRIDYGTLPVYSLNDCFLEGSNMEVGIDMADLLPEDFRSTNPTAPVSLIFRADADKDFMASRPPNSPTAHLEVCILPYLQSLTTHYHDHLHHYSLLASGKIGLKQYVRFCRTQKEALQHSKYTLPHSVQLTQEKVIEYLQMIKPGSTVPPEHITIRSRHLKELIVLHMLYQVLRSHICRSVMKKLLGEPLDRPAPDISTQAFSIRDMYELPNTSSLDQLELARMNECFLSARTQALDSTNVLANLLQIAYVCKFNLYCLGPTAIFAIKELMVVHAGMAKHTNHYTRWNCHKRLANIFEILRTLRYWSPALNMFVAGVQALSDQDCCINIPRNKEQFYDDLGYPDISATYEESRKSDQPSPAKRRRSDSLAATKAADKTANVPVTRRSSYPRPLSRSPTSPALGDETVSYSSVAEKIPEFPNPYPSNHIISIIIKELNISLAEFLAPAYPVLLLKLLNTPKSE